MLRDQLAKHMGSWVRGSVRSGGSSLVRVYSSGAGGSKDKSRSVMLRGSEQNNLRRKDKTAIAGSLPPVVCRVCVCWSDAGD
eukprot:1868705-Rhodomonas_salina.1